MAEEARDVELERRTLAAILHDPMQLASVIVSLGQRHFVDPFCRKVYAAMVELFNSGLAVDMYTVSETVGGDSALQISRLALEEVSSYALPTYILLLKEHAMRREVASVGRDLVALGSQDGDPFEMVQQAEERILKVSMGKLAGNVIEGMDKLVHRYVDRLDKYRTKDASVLGYKTGFPELDEKTGGQHRKKLTILAGRPSEGKTALALSIARNMAKAGTPVGILSMEMDKDEIMDRIAAMESGVSARHIADGQFTKEQQEKVLEAMREIHKWPLFLDETPNLSLSDYRARASYMVRRLGVKAIVVDYLQLMPNPPKAENRTIALGMITGGIRAHAKEYEYPVIVLSQLSRDVDMNDLGRPELSNLRDSGAIEQDADMVCFIYRPCKHMKKLPKRKEVGKYYPLGRYGQVMGDDLKDYGVIILAKQRGGIADIDFEVRFTQELTRFEPWERTGLF